MHNPDKRIPYIPDSVLNRREGDVTVLFDEESGEPFLVNETGSRIFELTDGNRCVEDIVAEVAGEFGADMDVIMADCMEFLDTLAGKGMVRYR
jgi:hypothetical protein